jgi:diacylglycerol O-acyltransferase/trehalose O-mycolyltransferase
MWDLTIESPALGRSGKVRPPLVRTAYRRWPMLYLLHGCCDTYAGGSPQSRRTDRAGVGIVNQS